MPRLDITAVSDLEILGRMYANNVKSYNAIHLSLRRTDKASSDIASDRVEVYLTDCYKDLNLQVNNTTNEYQAAGHLLSFDNVQESTDLQISSLNIGLSGVDRAFTAALLSYEYLDQPIKVYRVFLDESEQVSHAPLLVFSGNIDTPVITDNPSEGVSTISISAASTFVDFERRSGRKTNESEQVLYRSLNDITEIDTGFKYNASNDKEIYWGRT